MTLDELKTILQNKISILRDEYEQMELSDENFDYTEGLIDAYEIVYNKIQNEVD